MSIQLPNDWNIIELKDLIDKKRSIRYGIVQPGDYDENGRYMVRGQDYSFGWVGPENLFKVSDAIESKYKNARLKTGDIILTIVGAGTGTVAIVPEWLDGANCTQTTARIAIEPTKADSLFCYYYLSSDKGKKLTYQNIKGGAQPGLNCGDIEYFEIILPPLPEQKSIAKVLSTADAAIYTTEKLIAQKELRKKWLMQQLLTGKKRLKGFNQEWKYIRFREIYSQVKRKAGSEKYIVLSVTKDGIVSQAEYFNKEIASEDTSPYLVIKKGDMVMSGLNFWMGSIDVLSTYEIGMVSPAYKAFEISNQFISSDFMKQFVRSKLMLRALVGSSVTGASIVRRNMDRETLEEWSFYMPPLEEQIAIAKVLQAADKEIVLLKAKAEKLREQKKGLMQKLLTGKKRLI